MKYLVNLLLIICTFIAEAQWETYGPYGGSVKCLGKSDSLLFAGSYESLYKSNHGEKWEKQHLQTPINSKYFYSIASKDSFLLASGNNMGIIKSTNYGNDWEKLDNELTGAYIKDLIILDSTAYACAGKLYVSHNYGENWDEVTTLPNISCNCIESSDSIIVIGGLVNSSNPGNIPNFVISYNKGKSWKIQQKGIENVRIQSIYINNNKIYAGTVDGIYKKGINDSTWKHQGLLNKAVESITEDDDYIYAGTRYSGVYRSSDNGETWIDANEGLNNNNIQDLMIYNERILVATYAGVYTSFDHGENWEPMNNGILNTNVYDMAADNKNIYISTWAKGNFKSNKEKKEWDPINNNLKTSSQYGLTFLNIKLFDDTLYTSSNETGEIFYSGDSGKSWNKFKTDNMFFSYISNLAYFNEHFLVSSDRGVFLTSDRGKTWLQADSILYSDIIETEERLYAGTKYNGIKYSDDFGKSWKRLDTNFDTSIIIDITQNNHSIYGVTYKDKLFRYSKETLEMERIEADIVSGDLRAIEVYGDNIFIGTTESIYFSPNNGETWEKINDLNFNITVNEFLTDSNKIYAATTKGVFEADLDEFNLSGVNEVEDIRLYVEKCG